VKIQAGVMELCCVVKNFWEGKGEVWISGPREDARAVHWRMVRIEGRGDVEGGRVQRCDMMSL
jgi:hypothetical protein